MPDRWIQVSEAFRDSSHCKPDNRHGRSDVILCVWTPKAYHTRSSHSIPSSVLMEINHFTKADKRQMVDVPRTQLQARPKQTSTWKVKPKAYEARPDYSPFRIH